MLRIPSLHTGAMLRRFWAFEAAIWAASSGEVSPGRKATRNFSRSETGASIAVLSHASSHHAPVGVSAASNPLSSAARATCVR